MVRKHKGIQQSGKHAGRLNKGFFYTGKKTKRGLPIIKKAAVASKTKQRKKKTQKGGIEGKIESKIRAGCEKGFKECVNLVKMNPNQDGNLDKLHACEKSRASCLRSIDGKLSNMFVETSSLSQRLEPLAPPLLRRSNANEGRERSMRSHSDMIALARERQRQRQRARVAQTVERIRNNNQ